MGKIDFNKPNILFISNEQIDIDDQQYKQDGNYNRQKYGKRLNLGSQLYFRASIYLCL